jgi:hypothetical protein
MIQLNLNPAQAMRARPQSASLRTPRGGGGGDPSFNRLRNEGQATPRLPPQPDAPPGEEEPWLFGFERSLSTLDVWKMGFSRVVVFGAHHWADEATCAAELTEAFSAGTPLPGLTLEHKPSLETIIAPCFLKGDVLLAVQCTQLPMLPADEARECLKRVAKLVDAVSNVWTQYDEMAEPELGAVVVVLEGFGESELTADWGGGEDNTMTYPVAPLDEELSAFFKG